VELKKERKEGKKSLEGEKVGSKQEKKCLTKL
jgi:hypothetical protein